MSEWQMAVVVFGAMFFVGFIVWWLDRETYKGFLEIKADIAARKAQTKGVAQ